MSDFFKRNRILVGIILGVLYGFIYPNTDPELNPFCAKLNPYISNWCFYIQGVIGGGTVGGMAAAKTENDEQAIHRMAFGAFIGGVIGYLMFLPIASPINQVVWWFWTGALIGLAYRWAFKGALIGMILSLFMGIVTLFIEGLIGIKLTKFIVSSIFVAYLYATWGAGFWLLFGETSSSSRRHSRKDGY